MRWKPDPTFYPSPTHAMEAPPEKLAYVALLDPSGKEVERHDKVGTTQLFTGSRADASKSEIWSISVSNAVWAVIVNMYDPLVPIVSTNPETLLRVD